MRKLLNVLYITSPDSYLSKDGENVVIYCKDEEKFRIPIHNIEGIVCFNYTGASPALMAMCAENGVGLTFLNENDKFLARVNGGVKGNVLLRKKQYRISDDESQCVTIATNFIYGKILNCRSMLRRTIRDHGNNVNADKLEEASSYLLNNAKKVLNAKSLDEIRGIEGDAAKIYFDSFNEMILSQKDSFYMETRNKRPPKDNLNALLSFLYTILAHEVQSALETVGLDPYVGFLHRDRPGRASLALDLMEELRGPFADRLALTLINRNQINKNGFTVKENGSILLDDKTKKEVLAAWHARKQEEITHPFLDEKIKFGLIPYVQALLLSRFLREDLDGYPPFLLK
ncbi:CRISPR-associated protein, Cas1 family [Caloramator quimbayensis]|uniref:CRISPR-associated endonuclease Cas1 n=1 Tax=Caloramator quimbayensis TaxID=1147123 RepID=A0A1T4WLN4_9CLOT|nr:type I-C CRISPR-associated endonuclease Cas1c [Caloramator quimbayensis]SKA78270.1 CRISPR-associated protein, Cas1 family [Caloramator quimbayensis]